MREVAYLSLINTQPTTYRLQPTKMSILLIRWRLMEADGGCRGRAQIRSPKRAQVMFVCMFVCRYVFQGYVMMIKHLANPKWCQIVASMNNTLHSHDIIRVWFLMSVWHVKIENRLLS